MKILHTADLHIGQNIYQNYDRGDEHQHFFKQLKQWCVEHTPDALVVSGDVFDIQQPSAAVKKEFNDYFVDIHRTCPDMAIVITAGNHDSASRLQADSNLWRFANTTLVGTAPAANPTAGWEEKYVVRLSCGYIIAMPFMPNERKELLQQLLDYVAAENETHLPVVMMAHTTVTGFDSTGMEIGKVRTQNIDTFGKGFDYLALGHIHKPQTIGHLDDANNPDVTYPSPVIRYSGSALHVSCDEAYPHSVSLVEIGQHGGEVRIQQLRIDELRHFYTLPGKGSFSDAQTAILAIEDFCKKNESCYIRLCIANTANLSANFNQVIYDLLAEHGDKVRYNPKIIWSGEVKDADKEKEKPIFEVAELQQMTDPLVFIEKTIRQYPSLDMDEVRAAFAEVEEEIRRMAEEEQQKPAAKKRKNLKNNETEEQDNED